MNLSEIVKASKSWAEVERSVSDLGGIIWMPAMVGNKQVDPLLTPSVELYGRSISELEFTEV